METLIYLIMILVSIFFAAWGALLLIYPKWNSERKDPSKTLMRLFGIDSRFLFPIYTHNRVDDSEFHFIYPSMESDNISSIEVADCQTCIHFKDGFSISVWFHGTSWFSFCSQISIYKDGKRVFRKSECCPSTKFKSRILKLYETNGFLHKPVNYVSLTCF